MKYLGLNIADKKTLENVADKLEQEEFEQDILEEHICISKVSFSIMCDGSVDISCEWERDIPQLSQVLPLMLEMINTGQYEEDLERALMSNDDKELARECLKYWESIKNEPIIRPHEVFQGE